MTLMGVARGGRMDKLAYLTFIFKLIMPLMGVAKGGVG